MAVYFCWSHSSSVCSVHSVAWGDRRRIQILNKTNRANLLDALDQYKSTQDKRKQMSIHRLWEVIDWTQIYLRPSAPIQIKEIVFYLKAKCRC